ncbi:MAG: TAXI family TRAP transporter solute-binding subunit [Planctomycetes bacterium]|nr:TAXI family TRAP transporter solute-binding subunit [Planctomycetota bacterium]
MRKSTTLMLAAVVFALAAGFVQTGERLTMGTGGTAGVYYPLGGAMAQLITNKNPGVEVSAQSTGATGENLRLIQAHDIDIAIVQNDLTHAAYNGEAPFTSKLQDLRAVGRLYPEYLHVIASVDSGIKQIADFKGKRVSVGARGSGNEANCRQIFDFYGLSYDNIQAIFLPYGETADQFKDRQIDAFVFTIGTPNPAIQDITTLQTIQFVPVDGKARDDIVAKFPYFAKDQIPADSYRGQTTPVETLSVQAMLIVNKNLSDDLVYAITKTIFDNIPELAQSHSKAAEFDLTKAMNGVTIPLHPGAERYFKEKGVLKWF